MARGGTTTVEVTRHGEVVAAYTSLNGTMMNCSGGQMPWGAWITCEETVNGPDVGPDFTGASNIPLTKPHGFVFEVPAGGQSDRRADHAAPAASPTRPWRSTRATGYLYLTEDNFGFPSGFYRYRPATTRWRPGGSTTAAGCRCSRSRAAPNAHLEAEQPQAGDLRRRVGRHRRPGPDVPVHAGQTAPTTNDQALMLRRRPGPRPGAAYFSRLEGQVYDNGVVYFTSTQGGGAAETGPTAASAATATGSARSGPTTPGRRSCS